jgi:hypothetical protein
MAGDIIAVVVSVAWAGFWLAVAVLAVRDNRSHGRKWWQWT